MTSMDQRQPFAAECTVLVANPQGCGLRASASLPPETPVLLTNLPGAGSASARVANCLPLGNDGKQFLIGLALYNPGNAWGIPDPPEDWNYVPNPTPSATAAPANKSKATWPYNLFSHSGEAHPGRK